MADTSEATVIDLQSHPAWIEARRYERELRAAVRRHPSCRRRRDADAFGGRNFRVYSGTDTPA